MQKDLRIKRDTFDSNQQIGVLRGSNSLSSNETECLSRWLKAIKLQNPFFGKNKRTTKVFQRKERDRHIGVEMDGNGNLLRGARSEPTRFRQRDIEFDSISLWHVHLGTPHVTAGEGFHMDVPLDAQAQNVLGVDSEEARFEYWVSDFLVHYALYGSFIDIIAISAHGVQCWIDLQKFLEKERGWSITLCSDCNAPIISTGPTCGCSSTKTVHIAPPVSTAKFNDFCDGEIVRNFKHATQSRI